MAAYARQAVARTTGGWSVSGLVVSNVGAVTFPACASGSATVTHAGVGSAVSGAGRLFYFGALTSPSSLAVSAGITPAFAVGVLTFTLSGGFATTEGGNALKAIFQAVAWDAVSQDDGSSPLTNLYVSLHTSSPGVGGDQTTNEASYS